MLNFAKKYSLFTALALILSLFLVDFFFVRNEAFLLNNSFGAVYKEGQAGKIPKLSEIEEAGIDSSAVSVSVEKVNQGVSSIKELPASTWIALLFAYVALLIFNLSYEFPKTKKPRWLWESLFTLVFLFGWLYLDPLVRNMWFPLYVLKIGLVVYVIYLYFLEKKLSSDNKYQGDSLET